MVEKVVFEDEIALYWDKQWELKNSAHYCISVNGEKMGNTEKTYFVLKNLTPEVEYRIKVERLNGDGSLAETLFVEKIITPKARRRIDVTKAPYNAVGDGKTLNTKALQKAFDDCGNGETVYIPAGTYLTGSLKLHSEMEL